MKSSNSRNIALVCFAAIMMAAILVHVHFWNTRTEGEDIYYDWVDGGRILHGETPISVSYPATCERTRSTPPTSRSSSSYPL